MKVLMISSDRNIAVEGSAAHARIAHMRGLVDVLDIVIVDGRRKFSGFFSTVYSILASRKSYDVVTVQDPFFLGVIGVVAKLKFGAKLHVQVHTDATNRDFIFESMRHVVSFILMFFVLPFASAVRVVSERVKRGIEQYTTAPITVLPISVPVAAFAHEYPRPLEFGEHQVVLAVSRLTNEKRVELIIAAMKHVPRAHLYVVGDGPRRGALHRAGVLAGIQDRVHFMGWQHNVAAYFQHADCFVNASKYEGYGMTLVESLLAGTPVITTDVGVASELPEGAVTIVRPDEYEMGNEITRVLQLRSRVTYTVPISDSDEYAKKFIQSLT